MTRLGVNIDHVATLRRLRDTPYPNLLEAAQLCIKGGAKQITVHLREDRRHIVDEDVLNLKKHLNVDLNLEMAATEEMLEFALKVKPHSICVVPEKREERTTEGGLDLSNSQRNQFLKSISEKATKHGILVSFFIEPDVNDVKRSHELGAKAVELHTGSLCIAHQTKSVQNLAREWTRYKTAVAAGNQLGLLVHAGHGIDLAIAKELVEIPGVVEFNIGHSIVCDAIYYGIEEATRRMARALNLVK